MISKRADKLISGDIIGLSGRIVTVWYVRKETDIRTTIIAWPKGRHHTPIFESVPSSRSFTLKVKE